MSLVVVIKGPVAMAGSILNFSNVIGTNVPNIEANITTANSDMLTATVISASVPISILNANVNNAIILALINDTPTSFRICVPTLRRSNDPFANPCTMIADDCTPTFPAVPAIKGIKRAMAGTAASPASNPPSIIEFNNPPKIPITNHGNLALVWVKTLSSTSTSCEIPDAN